VIELNLKYDFNQAVVLDYFLRSFETIADTEVSSFNMPLQISFRYAIL